MKKTLIIVLLSSTMIFGFQLFPGKGQMHNCRESRPQRIIEELNLTDVQQKQIEELRYDHQKAVLDIQNQISNSRLDMKKLMSENKSNKNKAVELANKNIDLRSKIQKSRIEMWSKIYDILDDNQKEIWEKNLDNPFDRRMNKFRGFHRDNRMPGCRFN